MEDSITEYKAGIYCQYDQFKKDKRSQRELAKRIIGFANAFGGNIFIGINDKSGLKESIKKPGEIIKLISQIIRDQIKPRLLFCKVLYNKEEDLIEVRVRESPLVHHDNNGEVHFRIGERVQKIHGYEAEALKEHKKRLKPNYWYEVAKALTLLESIYNENKPELFFSGIIDFCLRCGVLLVEESFFNHDLLDV